LSIEKDDKFLTFITKMQDCKNYVKMEDLKDKYCYKIYARNAYVGIWVERKKSFMISRYKVGPNSYLFEEYHWDTGPPLGTVKPLMLIEKCPFQIKDTTDYNEVDKKTLLNYLDRLEESNPIVKGFNSLKNRRSSAVNFEKRLSKGHNDMIKIRKE